MTVKELKEDLDQWDDDAVVEWWEDEITEGIGIHPPGSPYPAPEHIIEI